MTRILGPNFDHVSIMYQNYCFSYVTFSRSRYYSKKWLQTRFFFLFRYILFRTVDQLFCSFSLEKGSRHISYFHESSSVCYSKKNVQFNTNDTETVFFENIYPFCMFNSTNIQKVFLSFSKPQISTELYQHFEDDLPEVKQENHNVFIAFTVANMDKRPMFYIERYLEQECSFSTGPKNSTL